MILSVKIHCFNSLENSMKNISLLTIIFVGSIFLTTFADTITSFSIDGVKIGDSEFKTKENMPAPSSVKMLGRHQPNLYRYLRESGPVQIQYSSDKVYSIRGKGLKRGKSLILWEGVNLSRVRKIEVVRFLHTFPMN